MMLSRNKGSIDPDVPIPIYTGISFLFYILGRSVYGIILPFAIGALLFKGYMILKGKKKDSEH